MVEEIYEPYEDVQHNSIPKQQPQSEPQTRTVTKKVVVQLTRFEKYLYITLVTAIAVIAIYMLSLKMDAYDTNGKIADLDSKLNNNQVKIAQFNLKLRKVLLTNAFTTRLKHKV